MFKVMELRRAHIEVETNTNPDVAAQLKRHRLIMFGVAAITLDAARAEAVAVRRVPHR